MRTLLLLRGAPGSGKSTWIKNNGLEPYTLEADKFRMLVSSPLLNEDGEYFITQNNDTQAWDNLLACLEERMKDGHFTVIDATHNSPKLTKKYEALAETYKYSIFYYQPETTLQECLDRQLTREEHKKVPASAVERMYALIQNVPLPSRCKRIYDLSEIDNFYTQDISDKFEKVKLFGDVHGCYTVLRDSIASDLPEEEKSDSIFDMIAKDDKTLYVFLGDYVDRGIENYQTMKELFNVVQLPNAILLEGNHDIYPYRWAINQPKTESRSPYYLKYTLPECLNAYFEDQGVNLESEIEKKNAVEDYKKLCRKFYKKLRQAYAFSFNGQKYLATHGGLTSVPDKMIYIPTKQLIKGVGDYETDVGTLFDESYLIDKTQGFIQFHGHRGVTSGQYSYCLEGEVEFGGVLKVATITKDEIDLAEFKNTVFKVKTAEENWKVSSGQGKHQTQCEEVNQLLNSRLINSKSVEPNLVAINFKESAFRKRAWNDLTIKARGLFVDAETGEVKLRSFPKFFNYGELEQTSPKALKNNLAFPCFVYMKYNGFLGIMSNVNGELLLASKSTTQGEHVGYFKDLWNRESQEFKDYISTVTQKYNCSLIFEVLHNQDPHIVEHGGEEGLILLGAVENKLGLGENNFDREFSDTVVSEIMSNVAIDKASEDPKFNLKAIRFKELCFVVQNYDDLMDSLKTADNQQIEGYVVEDSNGFMFKYKGKYYTDWKRRRGLVAKYLKLSNQRFPYQLCRDSLDVSFIKWVTEQDIDWVRSASLLSLRGKFYETNNPEL